METCLLASTRKKSLNLFISYVAFRIYRRKMLCRLDSLSETAYNFCITMLKNLFIYFHDNVIMKNTKNQKT